MRQLRVVTLLSVLACALLSVSALLAQTPAAAVRIVNPIDEKHLVTLKGFTPPLANAKNDRGAAPDDMQLDRMHLVLKRSASQDAALRQLIGELHRPGSASYHKWLTPEQFGKQFGPSDADIATVSSWLTSHGFSITKVNPGKQTLEFGGSVAQFRSAFHAQVHKYEVNGETHHSVSSDPQIPAALTPVVGGFVSLNNFRAKSYVKKLGEANYDTKTGKAHPLWTIGNPGTPAYQDNFVLSPQDYAIQYDLKPLYTAGTTGAGQTIAIVNNSNINVARVNTFRSLFGLSVNPPQVIIDGNDPGVDGINNPDGPNGDSVEAYLDVEWSGAVAPDATIDLVVAADTALEGGLVLAMEHTVYGNLAPVMSLSFGSCEAGLGSSNGFLSNLWEQAAAQGMTVMVSSGDDGSAACDSDSQDYAVSGQAVSGWASTPYNVAVGGTDFYYSDYNQGATALDTQLATYWSTTDSNSTPVVSIKGVIPEQPWNDSQYGLNIFPQDPSESTTIAAGSGGASNAAVCSGNDWDATTGACDSTLSGYPKPAWQSGATVPADGVRDLPDVSLFASNGANDSYYPICATDGDCQPVSSGNFVQIYGVGGTSASSPAFAGIMALVNQKYGPQGQADFVLYPLKAQFAAAFHNVTHGTNSVPCDFSDSSLDCISVLNPITDINDGTVEGQIGVGTTPEYNATTGYNLATGLGTIDANVLVTDWNKVSFTASTTTLTPSSATTFAHGSTFSFSGTVTGAGTPSGDVALLTDSTEAVQQGQAFFTLSGGAYSGSTTTLPGGSYNVWAQYGGDSTNGLSNSAPIAITVTKENSGLYLNVFNPVSGGSPTTIPSGTTSIPYGTQITLSALAAPSSALSAFESCFTGASSNCPVFTTPTGTVTFKDGSTTLNTAVVNAEGDAEFYNPSTYNVGTHSITASYSGDASYSASSAAASTFTIVQAAPVLQINEPFSANGLAIPQGTASTLSILVEGYGNGVAPSGTVTITGAPSGTTATATLSPAVDPSYGVTTGTATVVIPATAAAGTYTIGAGYTPDTAGAVNYLAVPPTSGLYQFQISGSGGTATTIAATASATSPTPTAAINLTGTVTAASGAAPAGTVYVLFSALDPNAGGGSATSFQYTLNLTAGTGSSSTFSAQFNSGSLPQGADQFTILYYPSTTAWAPSTALVNLSNPLSDFTLVPNATIEPISISAGANSATDSINLASVNGFTGAVNLTCTAQTGISCTIPASATLASGGSGSATLTINAGEFAPNGTYNVVVTGADSTGAYVHTLGVKAIVTGSAAGSTSFALSNSGDLTLDAGVNTGNTSTITVTPLGGFTGTVALGCVVAPAGADSPTCSLASPSLTFGAAAQTDVLTVTTSATTASNSYTVTVTGTSGSIAPTTVVNVSVSLPAIAVTNSGNISFTAGATTGNTATITVTPTNGFTGTVNLSCSVAGPTGANDPATCSLPASVAISGSAAQTATLTVNSTATTTTSMNQPQKLFWPAAGGTALALVFLFGIPAKRRKWMAMFALLIVLATGAAIGCGGGGSSSGGGGGTTVPGTTAGAYVVTVTATSGSITKTTTVTATVN